MHSIAIQATGASPNEIVKYVRQNLEFKNNEYVGEKVKSRSKGIFTTFKAQSEWKDVLQRRIEQRNCGFFARQDEVYKECGKVDLDSKNLVLTSLKKIGNFPTDTQRWKKLSTLVHQDDHKTLFTQMMPKPKGPTKKKASRIMRETKTRHKKDIDNGMQVIRKSLYEAERRIISIKGGQSLRAYVRNENEERKRKEEERESSGNTLDMVLLDPLQDMNIGIERESDTELLSEGQNRCRPIRDFLEMLDCLIQILSPLQNIRPRDLKSRLPLSPETLKMLRKQGKQTLDASKSRISFGNSNNRDSDNGKFKSHCKKTVRHNRPRNSVIMVPVDKHDTWEYFLSLGSQPENKVETINTEIECTARHGSRSSMLSHLIKSLPIGKRVLVANGKVPYENIPPWHKASAEQKDTKDKEDTTSCLTAQRHDVILDKLRTDFREVKKTYADELKSDLTNRSDAYKVQLETLELNHLREIDMKRMRRKNTDWRRQIVLSTARPASWFQELKDKLKELQLSNDDEALEKMQALQKFMDIKSCGSIKAKFCLLFFSIPLYEVCAVIMRKSLLFCTTKILELPKECLIEWLNIRRLSKLLIKE